MFPFYSFHPLPTIDGRWRPKVEERAPNCPRCDSSNTKFCYYNNYCLTQPRYLCKGCRRYWTKGGSLRNIPVGGGCRKSRRGKSVKLNTTVSSSLSSPPNSFRPDHALENMSGGTGGSFPSPNQSIHVTQSYAKFLKQCPELEQQEASPIPMMMPFDLGSLERQSSAEIGAEVVLSNNYMEKRLMGEENDFLHEFMEIQGRGFGELMDYNNNYLMGSSNYALETDLLCESSRFQGIGISEIAQQNLVGSTSLEAFLIKP